MVSNSELKSFAGSLSLNSLTDSEDDARLYVDGLHNGVDNPIQKFSTEIDWNINAAGVYLFTGMAGTGKTTELYRLKTALQSDGHIVFLIDGLNYIQEAAEVGISDFLISILIGLVDSVEEEYAINLFGKTYAKGFLDLMKSVVLETSVTAGTGPIKAVLKMNLKKDLSFRKKLRQKLSASLASLLEIISNFTSNAADTIREKEELADDKKVIVLIDSLEKMRGDQLESGTLNDPVIASLSNMVSQYTDSLFLDGFHMVYSIPPYLLKLATSFGNRVDGVCHLTTGHLYKNRSRKPDETGLAAFQDIITKRYPSWGEILTIEALDRLALSSGGDIREYFRLIQKTIITAFTRGDVSFPIDESSDIIKLVRQAQVRDYLPLPNDVKTRLRNAMTSYEPAVDAEEHLDSMVRDMNQRRLLMFRNGEDWYLPHPLLWDELGNENE